jgi:hypothetical protein
MRYFHLLDFQYAVMALFVGLVSVILVYMAWAGYSKRLQEKGEEELSEAEGHAFRAGRDVEKNPVAPLLIFIYIGVVVWAIAYVVVIGIRGAPF